MKELLKLLVELQRKDSLILEKRRFIDRVPLRIHEVDEPLKQASGELEVIRKKNESAARKKREKEQALAEAQEKIRKMKARVSDLKTNKEYQAYQKEIEASEKEIFAIEDGILLLMEETEMLSKEQQEREKRVNAEMEKMKAFRNELEEHAAHHEKELDILKAERAEMVSRLDADIYRAYMTLLRDSDDGVAVITAQDELCSGCNLHIPPQLYVEIRKNDEIIQCPQCRRILYASEE